MFAKTATYHIGVLVHRVNNEITKLYKGVSLWIF